MTNRRTIDLDSLEQLVLEMSDKHTTKAERRAALKLVFGVLKTVADAPYQAPVHIPWTLQRPLSDGPYTDKMPYSPFTTWCDSTNLTASTFTVVGNGPAVDA